MNLELGRGAHVCHFFTNEHEQKAVTLGFIKAGLDRGESCALVTPDDQIDNWCFELQAHGVDVFAARSDERLNIIPASEWPPPGEFNSILMARAVWRSIEAALVRSEGVRVLADMSWTFEPLLPADKLCHWEASSNLILEDAEVRVICQYDLSQHSPASINAALRAHPLVLMDGKIRSNPFCEAASILEHEPLLNNSDTDADAIEAMIAQLRNAT